MSRVYANLAEIMGRLPPPEELGKLSPKELDLVFKKLEDEQIAALEAKHQERMREMGVKHQEKMQVIAAKMQAFAKQRRQMWIVLGVSLVSITAMVVAEMCFPAWSIFLQVPCIVGVMFGVMWFIRWV